MLDLAIKHIPEINLKMYDTWYDPKYQYFYSDVERGPLEARAFEDYGNFIRHAFVSMNKNGDIIGLIMYQMDTNTRLVKNFGLISFAKSPGQKLLFGKDLQKVFCDIFEKFNANTIEIAVVYNNPIRESYEKIILKHGGRILCTRSKRAVDMRGNLWDDELLEITITQYFNSKKKRDG